MGLSRGALVGGDHTVSAERGGTDGSTAPRRPAADAVKLRAAAAAATHTAPWERALLEAAIRKQLRAARINPPTGRAMVVEYRYR